jgi:zinc-ribbon domain
MRKESAYRPFYRYSWSPCRTRKAHGPPYRSQNPGICTIIVSRTGCIIRPVIKCPSCGHDLPDSAKFCDVCGKAAAVPPLLRPEKAKMSGAKKLTLIVLLVIGGLLGISVVREMVETANSPAMSEHTITELRSGPDHAALCNHFVEVQGTVTEVNPVQGFYELMDGPNKDDDLIRVYGNSGMDPLFPKKGQRMRILGLFQCKRMPLGTKLSDAISPALHVVDDFSKSKQDPDWIRISEQKRLTPKP